MGIWPDSTIPYGFTLEKNQNDGTIKNRLWLISLHFIKIFKEHTQALIRDKLPEEERDFKSVVAEFQNKNVFPLMEEKHGQYQFSFLKLSTILPVQSISKYF